MNHKIYPAVILSVAMIVMFATSGCADYMKQNVEGSEVKVAKVDTEYIYEANVSNYVVEYKQSARNSISIFMGFPPDTILSVREKAIDDAIRAEIRRLPGITIDTRERASLADEMTVEHAMELHRQLVEDGASFEALAREYSDAPSASNGGLMDSFIELGENAEAYQIRAYSMEVGEISEPLESWDGWRIIKLEDITEDPLLGNQYTIRMIHLAPDLNAAEDILLDEAAEGHTIEILDPKYNSRLAYEEEDYASALSYADEAVERNPEDDLAHYLRARCLWAMERQEEAIEAMASAAEVGRIQDQLIPYYQLFRGDYLEKLDRTEEAGAAYRECYNAWQQDATIALELLASFERLGDDEYYTLMSEEIESIKAQDAMAWVAGTTASRGGVITTDQGISEGSSVNYEPAYRGSE